MRKMKKLFSTMGLLWIGILAWSPAFSLAQTQSTPQDLEFQKADVDTIKNRYWSQGQDSEMGVIQRRLYPRKKHFELSVSGGPLIGDPLLSLNAVGARLGFHLTEKFSLHALYLHCLSSASSALDALQSQGGTANINNPKSMISLEARFGLAHGKLASIGSGMFFNDFYFSIGSGLVSTDTGTSFAGALGLGQQLRLSQSFSVDLGYRLIGYPENLPNTSSRFNLTHGVFLDISLYFSFSSKKRPGT